VGGQQRITSHRRAHLAVAQDEVGEHREHRAARGALDAPDGKPTQADTGVMGVTRQAPTATTGRLVCQLKAQGQEKGEDAFDKRLAIAKQLKVGRFVSKIDSDGAVFAGPFGSLPHVSPPDIRSRQQMRHDGGHTLQYQDHREGFRALLLKAMECAT
jgi:hypothetical protein